MPSTGPMNGRPSTDCGRAQTRLRTMAAPASAGTNRAPWATSCGASASGIGRRRQEGGSDGADAAGGHHREGEEAVGRLVVGDRSVDGVHGALLEDAARGRRERHLDGHAVGGADRSPGAGGIQELCAPRAGGDQDGAGARATFRRRAEATDQGRSARRGRRAEAWPRRARREPPWPGWRHAAEWGSRSPAAPRTGHRPASARADGGPARPGRRQPGTARSRSARPRGRGPRRRHRSAAGVRPAPEGSGSHRRPARGSAPAWPHAAARAPDRMDAGPRRSSGRRRRRRSPSPRPGAPTPRARRRRPPPSSR